VTQLVQAVLDKFGRIDVLVNVAAVMGMALGLAPLVDTEESKWRRFLDINLTGTFLLAKLVARHMIARGGGGKIVNIASVSGKVGQKNIGGYSASKAGVISLTQTLALELGPHRINVNSICPGNILTYGARGPMLRQALREGLNMEDAVRKAYASTLKKDKIALTRIGTPEEIAGVVSFLACADSDYVTGQSINVDGGTLYW
jgi:NAD(P)-dependent dehydrogenase (short-subunit alcohol dehydrogenase family)